MKRMSPLHFHIITLFPQALDSYINESIISRAQKEKLIKISTYNPRSFVKPTKSQAKNEKPYLRVDDKPYGGGPGMVIQAEPIIKAIDKALSVASGLSMVTKPQDKCNPKKAKKKTFKGVLILFLSPSGIQFNNEYAQKCVQEYSDIIIVCGRYEGIDARVKEIFPMVDVSIGPFVTTGGELPALLIMDVVSRQIPGVLGNFESREEARISSSDVYTRPEVFTYKGEAYSVPDVLLSGNHKEIDEWRKSQGGFTN